MSWSNLDLAFHCLADVPRTEAFIESLREFVTPESVVLDAGSGSGVLAVAAAKLGAREVIAVERDPLAARILAWNVHPHSLPITVLCGDLRDVTLPPCDIVVAELVDVWLLEEQLVEVVSFLRNKGVIHRSTHLLPCAYDFDLEFGHCDWQFPYLEMRSPFYEWPYLFDKKNGWSIPHFEPVTDVVRIGTIRIREIESADDRNLCFVVNLKEVVSTEKEYVNAVRLSGILHLSNTVSFQVSGSLNAPVVLPIETKFLKAQNNEINIRAVMSAGFQTLSMSLGTNELLPWQGMTMSSIY